MFCSLRNQLDFVTADRNCMKIYILLIGNLLMMYSLQAQVSTTHSDQQKLFLEHPLFDDWSIEKQKKVEPYVHYLLAKEPDNQFYHYLLGQTHAKTFTSQRIQEFDSIDLTYFDKAKMQFETLMRLDTNSYLPYFGLMNLCFDKGKVLVGRNGIWHPTNEQYEQMVILLDEALAQSLVYAKIADWLHPNYIPTLQLLAEIYARQNNFDQVFLLKQKIGVLEKKH